jgi:hypothetical protein
VSSRVVRSGLGWSAQVRVSPKRSGWSRTSYGPARRKGWTCCPACLGRLGEGHEEDHRALIGEPCVPNRVFWKGRRVFLTGHTGFKESWLSIWHSLDSRRTIESSVLQNLLNQPAARSILSFAGCDLFAAISGGSETMSAAQQGVNQSGFSGRNGNRLGAAACFPGRRDSTL